MFRFFYVHRHILFYLDIWNLQCGKQRILLIFPVFSNRKQKWFLVWSLYSSSLEEYTAMPTSDHYSVMLLEYTHEPLITSIIFIIETQLHLARIVQVSIMWPLGMKRQHGFRDEKKKDKLGWKCLHINQEWTYFALTFIWFRSPSLLITTCPQY